MPLIKSISGIRGTIGGRVGEGLSPLDTVKFTAAFGSWIKKGKGNEQKTKMVIGRDARISGEMVRNIVVGTLQSVGIDVIDIGLATTPTVEIAVTEEQADGGIIITASHNPKQWNALKLLNGLGEFISAQDGADVLSIANNEDFSFVDVDVLGNYTTNDTYLQRHIDMILALPLVDKEAISNSNFKIVVDAVNSVGGICIPDLLRQLGVNDIIELYCEPTGEFPHNPEPIPENLTEIAQAVKDNHAHLGIVVDPDVDRLALISEDGNMFGEEYTLVAVADYVLQNTKGNTVSNLSSSRALRDITERIGKTYTASAVGEVNVVAAMKETHAVIGGEGNGGIIYPDIHYGRDALVGIALFLSHLAKSSKKVSVLRASYPNYCIAKKKIQLTPDVNVAALLSAVKEKYCNYPVNTIDGVKIDMPDNKEWIHLRISNTEPIIRIYAESATEETANKLANKVMEDIMKCEK